MIKCRLIWMFFEDQKAGRIRHLHSPLQYSNFCRWIYKSFRSQNMTSVFICFFEIRPQVMVIESGALQEVVLAPERFQDEVRPKMSLKPFIRPGHCATGSPPGASLEPCFLWICLGLKKLDALFWPLKDVGISPVCFWGIFGVKLYNLFF